jgi:hypothetical protein
MVFLLMMIPSRKHTEKRCEKMLRMVKKALKLSMPKLKGAE